MATIETAEGQTLIVENCPRNRSPSLHVKGRLDVEDGFGKSFDVKLFDIYSKGASASSHCEVDRPRSRGDLTADVMEDLVNRLVGYAVAEGWADRRSEITVDRVTVEERDDAKQASKAYVPNWEDDWPEDGSRSDQVRYILDNDPTFTDEQIAAGVGCSRSLVTDIKEARAEEDAADD